jgi:ribosome-associated protein
MKLKKSATTDLVKLCCRVLDDKKAGELTVLDVSAQSSITDFLILATATSEPHLRALRVELEKALDSSQVHLVGMETAEHSGWTVIDAFDVMIHLFLSEARERYGLERLWRDAVDLPLAKLLEKPKPPAAKARTPRKTKATEEATKRKGKGTKK